ncbi:MAG: chromosome segregation protein SMC [Oscillospiraceae bacterium]|jgi:chromosome segregation protein|nr:chromosome segregation protein SMC [Oscillospiraceae bacterium]
MFFKSLEIHGFKSFPDKTILNFDSKMTALVGSNGNGKSNISDALRWVMGEQGAKTLRGDKMEDVIFHGTQKRKQMGFARVTLLIDNGDHALNTGTDEVSITRKLYRDGESEYLINGAKSRLKDIHELLMGTGLGREGYSIVGQGRVAEIINSKGKERREIFEEAAGVTKFLHKKEHAERELGRANENILRLLDITKELEDRLPVLAKQAEKAKKAVVLIEKEKKIEISVSVAELKRIDESMLDTENKILQNEGECEHYDREITLLEERNEQELSEKMHLSAKMSELSRANEGARDEIAETDKQRAVNESEIVHNNGRVDALHEQIEGSKKSADEIDRQVGALNLEIEGKQSELADISIEANEQNTLLTQISEEGTALDSDSKELDREIALLIAKRTEARVSLSNSEQAWADLKNQLEEITEQTQSRESLIDSYKAKKSELQKNAELIEEEKQENENKLAGYSRLLESKRGKAEESEQSLSNLRREHDRKKSRFDVLSDVERNMTGYFASVKAVISASKSGQMSGVHGTVADIIKVGGKFSTAVEIALGSALQNIIVENEETAKRCIRFLKESNAGRATFLPLTSIKGRELELSAFPELADEDGYLGLGHELISFDNKYSGIIKSLLGRTAVAEDIDTATFLAKKYGYKFKIVTLDGQVINAGGSFTGGSVKETAGIISRKQEIQTLGNELGKLTEKLTELKNNHAMLIAEVNKMAIETEGYKEKAAELLNEEIKLNAEIGGIDNLIEQCGEQAENAQIIIDRNKSQMAAQEALIQKCGEILEETASLIKEKEGELEKLGALQATSAERRNKASDEITRLNLETLSVKKDIESLEQQIQSAEESKRRLGEDSGVLEKEIESLLQKNSELNEQIIQNKEKITQISASFSDNRKEIEQSALRISEIERKISDINREIREKSAEKERFSNALVLAKERKTTAETEINRIKEELWEKYELAPSEAGLLAEPITNMRTAKSELAEVRKAITALGSVNFAAIEEFTEVGERYKTLTEQLSDVEHSKSELEKLIAELTVSIKEKFLESFNAINYHFERIFTEIFGGGKARLELTDPEDVLGSGIEIFAAPPGKLIKNLISLSGGEQAMVAITIYFAILLHRPTPFCMLDEVDAALDEVNIIKYVTYLKRFSVRTQLMLITHRRGTIEGCDVLYGVFMQEKGVSRLLKQEITEDLSNLESLDVEII